MKLPPTLRVIERGWLSSNVVVLHDGVSASVIDSGYVKHREQTVALVAQAAEQRPITHLYNTHCHSDHVGGNAALVRAFGCRVYIPEGEAQSVRDWDLIALDLTPWGQRSERFMFDDTLRSGQTYRLGQIDWQVCAAPGHDMDALIWYAPQEKLLISGDALWEDGFGAVFPELANQAGLACVRATLDWIASLDVQIVIPGHGAPFNHVQAALARAYARLEAFEQAPDKVLRNALRVMLGFHLMDVESATLTQLTQLLERSPWHAASLVLYQQPTHHIAEHLVSDLQRAGVVTLRADRVLCV